jgi:dienelactone hydrolase
MNPGVLFVFSLACAYSLAAQVTNLPGTQPLTMQGDLSAQMVAGIDKFVMEQTRQEAAARPKYWHRDFSSADAYEHSVETNRARLAQITGAIYSRQAFREIEFLSTTEDDTKLWEGENYAAFAIRWPALDGVHGEGLWLKQKQNSQGAVIALPDADQTPEMLAGLELGIPAEAQFARRLAESGFDVFVPILINRSNSFSGNEELHRFTNQPHREWIYRQAYELGGNIIGYEVLKVLALADWLTLRGHKNIGLVGYGEGGLVGLYSAALDNRIKATLISGYFGPRENLWSEPIYHNVAGLLKMFGDAELASLIAPRTFIVEYSESPKISGPPPPGQGRSGAAPGKITTPEHYAVAEELDRARSFFPQSFKTSFQLISGNEGTVVLPGCDASLRSFAKALNAEFTPSKTPPADLRLNLADPNERQKRQVRELVNHVQHQMIVCERERADRLRAAVGNSNADSWLTRSREPRREFWENVLGRFDSPQSEMNPRSRLIYDEPKWRGYDVVIDVWPGVYAWGILCVPKDLKPGERRPVVVCQHGLEGVPRDTIDDPNSGGYGPYKSFTARLADRGFITFAPHNPYRGQDNFRVLQRKTNPIGRTLFSFIIGQHEQILNWLQTLEFVDPQRIGFYGLSYGGKSAMRIPAVLDRYVLSICSADFNDWIRKNVTVDSTYSYLFGGEYDMPEFALGRSHNYSEMAALIAPRPFMVERGHEDGVAPDEWVAYEFAKVKRFYDKLGVGDRTEIEVFNGPHTINGVGTFKFLHKHLNWPESAQ